MTNSFDSPRLLLDRARHNLAELNRETEAFIRKKPYSFVVEFDPDKGNNAHKIRFTERIPPLWSAIAFDVFGNLRSVLDQAIYASAVDLVRAKPTSTKFPFGDKLNDVQADIRERCKHVHPDICALALSFKPYEGGNDALWALNKVRNSKNHKLLAPFNIATAGSQLRAINMTVVCGFMMGPPKWDSAKNEIIVFETGLDAKVEGDFEVNVSFGISLDEVPVLGGQPAVAVLGHLCGIVERILVAIEAETARILAARG